MVSETAIHLTGDLYFRIRFNTTHGDTNLYWRVIIDEQEYLAASIKCEVPTFSDRSFDETANAIKFHLAGNCNEFKIGDDKTATFK